MGLVRNVSPFHLRRSQFFGGLLFGFWGVFGLGFFVLVLVCVCVFVCDSPTSEIF